MFRGDASGLTESRLQRCVGSDRAVKGRVHDQGSRNRFACPEFGDAFGGDKEHDVATADADLGLGGGAMQPLEESGLRVVVSFQGKRQAHIAIAAIKHVNVVQNFVVAAMNTMCVSCHVSGG